MTSLSRALPAAAVVAVLAAGAACWMWRAAEDGLAASPAGQRNDVGAAVEWQAAELNSISSADPAGTVQRWIQVSTGGLAERLAHDRDSLVRGVEAGKTDITGETLRAVVTSVDPGAGKADAIALLKLSVRDAKANVTVKRIQTRVGLRHVDGGWKVDEIANISQ
ncbi:hypothetical protein LWP59_26650 [Amycolatopsis acidiphila]|uniref:Mce-associated membrane protein n=1 Tax=Amycolatopsis acidiphila TaxID=715473 RepID=A0A558AIR0_9PSEU|nr:hypothetical protein [Amycolatopsis acidiphila]TVT24129.1 hypothetical protein FNH06_08010 [Amycolatopsis acidiphila]UIJ57707.1 hypothetical protein LWP59_26650 [Amycolatopsis acidiphila]GHG87202.1 hypothetical protein GCM10017788_60660 [Amycolatopsis acidiphila]